MYLFIAVLSLISSIGLAVYIESFYPVILGLALAMYMERKDSGVL